MAEREQIVTETNGSSAVSSETLESVRQHFQEHAARINAEHYRLGRKVVELMERGQEGFGCYTHAFRKLGLSVSSMSRGEFLCACIAARHFSEQACVKYGMRRLTQLLDYCRKAQLEWRVEDPGLLPIRVPDGMGALRIQTFACCTQEDLGRAIENVCQEYQKRQQVTRADEYCVHLLKQGLQRRFAENTSAMFKAFAANGRMHVSLRSVCVQDLGSLQAALRECLIRLEEEKKRTLPWARLQKEPSMGLGVSPAGPAPAAELARCAC